jgi:hypothetical protein
MGRVHHSSTWRTPTKPKFESLRGQACADEEPGGADGVEPSAAQSKTKDVRWARWDQRHGGLEELSTCPLHGSEPVALPVQLIPGGRSHSAGWVLCVPVKEQGDELVSPRWVWPCLRFYVTPPAHDLMSREAELSVMSIQKRQVTALNSS